MRLLVFLAIISMLGNGVHAQEETLTKKSLFGNMYARQIGPAVMSGRVSTLDAVASKPEIMYIGAAGGGVWKSTTAGATFRPVFDDYTQSIGKIKIDQKRPDTVWVGTGETWVRNSVSVGTGIYKTSDGGSSWKHQGLEESERISDIIIHPDNPDVVYVGVLGHLWDTNSQRGVFVTHDGGDSWEKIFYIDENTGCADLDVDPNNPDILYASMWSFRRYPWSFDSGFTGTSGLFKSTDGGKTWKEIHQGLPDEKLGRMAIAVAPSNGDIIYLTVEVKDKKKKGLYKSTNQGESWELVNKGFNITVRPFYFSEMVVDPLDENKIFKCGLDLSISKDGGESFAGKAMSSNVHSDIHEAWINPGNTSHVLIGTDGGVYESYDGGETFKMFMNLPISQFYHVSVDTAEPYNVYGGLQDNGSWYAPSQKSGGITNSDWKSSFFGDGFYSFRHPTDPNVVYSEYQGGNIVRYNKKTGRAKDIRPYPEGEEEKYRFNWNAPIHLSRINPERMYFGSQYVFMTEDRGDSWKIISPDLTTNDPEKQKQKQSGGLSIDNSTAENHTTIYTIAESPVNEKIIWVGTDDGNLQVTNDAGANWTNVVDNVPGLPKNTWVTFVEPGNYNENTVYVTFDGHRTGDETVYVYRSDDLGKTWTNLATEVLEGYALTIREDHVNENLIFLGTEFGLYLSIDKGRSWARFKTNVPKVGVRDMVVHPVEDALILGTHGRGVIIIDNISPLRQLNKEVLAEKIHFFETEPTILRDPGGNSDWFGGLGNFIGPNPTSSAQIIYYQKKRHTFGKTHIEIYDAEGNFIRKLPAGKSAGINIVTMPTRLKPPESAPTNNRMALFGAFFGPNMPAGEYTAKLIKGKEVYETNFALKYDEKSPYTAEEREEQRKLTTRLYTMSEDLAYLYNSLDEMSKQAEELAETNKKLTKKLTDFVSEVEELKNKMVFLGGDFYVDEEERIREEISDLYRKVSTYPGKPSESQVILTEQLEDRMAKIHESFKTIELEKLAKVNSLLEKAELSKISYMSKEEFLEED